MVLNLTPTLYLPIAAALVFLVFGGLLFVTWRHYRRLTRGVTQKDLKTVLENILKQIELNQKELEKLAKKAEQLEKTSLLPIQKVGFVRFNPFSDTGGDQSFSLALLNAKNSGIVLTSLHSRTITRFYAKKIKNGKPEKGVELSAEEKQALRQAQKR